jgi:hypothetical protein
VAGRAEDASGVLLLGTAATTSFGLGVILASDSVSSSRANGIHRSLTQRKGSLW